MSNRVMKDSEIEWIGEIPNHWGVKKIKHATEFVTCGVASTPVYAEKNDGGMFLSAQNVTKDNKLRLENASYIEKNLFESLTKFRKVQKGDVLQVRVGGKSNIGQTCVVNVDISAAVYVSLSHIRVDKNFNNRFFSYYIQQKPFIEFALLDAQKTVGQANLNVSNLKNYKLLVPPLSKQQAIADYLDEKVWQLDRLIGDQQQVIEDWKAYKQSLITETVTKGLNPEVELKDSGIEWMGEIPSHWEVKRLRNLGTTKSGLSNKTKEDFGFGNPFVNYGDVYKKDIIHATGLVDSTNDEIIKFSIKRGDVLFTGSSETIQELGMSSVALEDVEDSTYSGFLIRFKPYPGQLHPEFSRFLFRSAAMREFLIRDDNSVTRSNLSQKKLKNMPVIIPPLYEQQQIADFLDEKCLKIDQLIEDKQHLIEDLKAYKQSLIYECVTGKKEIV